MTNSYNGFTWAQREAKFKEMKQRIATGRLTRPHGPCRLCGDPGGDQTGVIFEYHDEDYGEDFTWQEPAAFMVCRDCHIYRIHQRTAHPKSWAVFLAHVRRGGYAREMRDPAIKAEFQRERIAILAGITVGLSDLRPYTQSIGDEWFAKLPSDPYSRAGNAP